MNSTSEKRGRGRPPKTDSHQRDTQQRLLRAGVELLTEYGFASVGLERVLKRVSVPKGSFYYYFASKDDFAQQVVASYGDYFASKLDRCLLNTQQLPVQRLWDFVEDGKQGLLRYEFKRGCLIGNMGQELATSHPVLRKQLEAVFVDWQQRVAQCLKEAQDAGQVPVSLDCLAWAEFFWIGWEGAVLRAKLGQSLAPIDLFANMYFAGLTSVHTED
ncbi:MAG: TetR family transcriptional regulator [Gammaproteobacteria bacterium]|nr:TetR family transcriptional regulator [Gammaproteobacteria bacterium]